MSQIFLPTTRRPQEVTYGEGMVSWCTSTLLTNSVEIFGARAEVFAPCALGGVINDRTIPELRVQIVAGAANNQLLDDRHGEMLQDKNILYAPDYVANCGGVFNGCIELINWDAEQASRKVEEIYDTMLTIFESAKEQGIATNKAADWLAENRLLGQTSGRIELGRKDSLE